MQHNFRHLHVECLFTEIERCMYREGKKMLHVDLQNSNLKFQVFTCNSRNYFFLQLWFPLITQKNYCHLLEINKTWNTCPQLFLSTGHLIRQNWPTKSYLNLFQSLLSFLAFYPLLKPFEISHNYVSICEHENRLKLTHQIWE